MLVFELNGTEWELSVMRLSYKFAKRTTKSEKSETNNMKNFRPIRYKLTALTSIIHSILN